MQATIITDGTKLVGQAMPKILAGFRKKVVGRTIVDAGYIKMPDAGVYPVLVLDNGETVYAMADDEGNGPGVMALGLSNDMLCETDVK